MVSFSLIGAREHAKTIRQQARRRCLPHHARRDSAATTPGRLLGMTRRWFHREPLHECDVPLRACGGEPEIPSWERARAFDALGITEVPFDSLNGNVMGFARGRTIAVSPLNPLPLKTTFHELAHVVLGHTQEADHADGELTPRNLREVEAESVALLCLAALNQPGVEHCRGYVQAWWGMGNPIPERSAQRILKAADQILKSGTNEGEAL